MLAVFSHSDRFKILDAFAAADLSEDLGNFIGTICGSQNRDRLADRLFRGVTVNMLGAFIPVSDDAVEVLADDGVLR